MYISIDGPSDMNDRQRMTVNGSLVSEIVVRNMERLNKMTTVGARATVTRLNVKRQREMVDYFLSLGIKFLFSKPVLPSVGADANVEYAVPLIEYAKQYLDA